MPLLRQNATHILACLIVLSFCLGAEAQPKKVTSEEYAIYSAILRAADRSKIMNRKREFPGEGKWGGRFVIQNTTSGPINDNYSKQGYLCNDWFPPRRLRPVFDNLLANNQRAYSLRRNFSITNQYTMLSTKQFANFFKTGSPFVGYVAFHNKYGERSGYFTLSRVGFNSKKTKALVYVFENCSAICAFSRFIQLNKMRGKWRVMKEFGC